MNYDEAILKITKLGIEDALPEYFRMIDDETIYPLTEIAEIIDMHPESVRRWCRKGQIKTEGVSHYKVPGIEMKRFLFKKVYNRLPQNVKTLITN